MTPDPRRGGARARRAHHHDRRRQRHRHALEHRPRASRSFPRWRTSSAASRRSASTTATTASSRFDHLCVACHGFSALATARHGDRTATVLFDVGPYGDVWLANAERLAVDLSSHRRAVPVALALGPLRRHHRPSSPPSPPRAHDAGRPPLVVDVHPDRPDQRGILTPFDVFAMLPPEPTLDAIEAAGGRVVAHADVHAVAGLFLASGDIPRQTSYETGLRRPPHLARRTR